MHLISEAIYIQVLNALTTPHIRLYQFLPLDVRKKSLRELKNYFALNAALQWPGMQ